MNTNEHKKALVKAIQRIQDQISLTHNARSLNYRKMQFIEMLSEQLYKIKYNESGIKAIQDIELRYAKAFYSDNIELNLASSWIFK